MSKNIYGDGSQTNLNGLKFEQETLLSDALDSLNNCTVVNKTVYLNNSVVGIIVSKNSLYKDLLIPNGVDYKKIISKKLLPDDALYLYSSNTVYIIEKKFQNTYGSVDEKLQTCDFKKKQYTKLLKPLNLKVEYIYVLSDWFKKDQYRDVLDYIIDCKCHYYFNEIPADTFNLI